MRRVATLGLFGLLLFLPAPAPALTVTQDEGFSGQLDFIDVTPFDPALGTLDRVLVSISGQLLVQIVSGRNILVDPSGAPQPQPYLLQLDVTQEFVGLGGRYFEFDGPGTLHFASQATGNGEALVFSTPFSYDFAFDAVTDLLGFTFPSTSGVIPPPGGIVGTRARFVDDGVPLDLIQFVQQFALIGQQPNATATVVTPPNVVDGLLRITYDFTPPAPVAEPSSLILLGLGLAAVAARVGVR